MQRKAKITILYDAQEDREKQQALSRGEPLQLAYETVSQALIDRGHEVRLLAASARIQDLSIQLADEDSELLFNLCEGLGGVGQHEQHVAAILEVMGRRFTGAGSLGLSLAQDKAIAKKIFSFHGLPHPRFSTMEAGQVDWSDDLQFPVFIKPVDQDASIGIDAKAKVNSLKELMERISSIHRELGSAALVEEYIEGRELYVGILGNEKPQALPLLEWDFSQLPEGTPQFASDDAKWVRDSAANRAPEVFPDDLPEALSQAISDAAIAAFRALKLRDYARIDIRLRQDSREESFFIIEANPNPHLAPDGELALAAGKAGLEYPDLIERIVELALAHRL